MRNIGNRVQILLFFLAVVFFPNLSHAANHFVRAGATGSNSGGDWINAFTDLPAQLVRGDTYYIANGDYRSYVFDDLESGTLTITIKRATVLDHGTDLGWDDAFAAGSAVFTAPVKFSTDFYVIDGQTRTDVDGVYGIKVDNSVALDRTAAVYIGLFDGSSASNITLRFVDVQGSGDLFTDATNDAGIRIFRRATNITISHCAIHDLGGVGLHMRAASNFVLEHTWMARNDSSPGNTGPHAEGISMSDELGPMELRYNILENVEGTAIFATPSAADNDPSPGPWHIYGNVFWMTPDNCTETQRTGPSEGVLSIFGMVVTGEVDFFNNSILNINLISTCGGNARARVTVAGSTVNTLKIRNNLWWNCDPGNNNWASIGTGNVTNYISTHWAFYDVGNTTDPEVDQVTKQVRTGIPFIDFANRNFRLKSETLAGFDTSSELAANSTDPRGLTRGVDGLPDRGAFEFLRPNPPTNLRVGP